MRAFLQPLVQGRTYRRLGYLLLAMPLGLLYFVTLVAGIAVGLGTLILWIGVPILVGMMLAWRAAARFERSLASALLDATVDPAPPPLPPADRLWARIRALVSQPYTWRSLLWLLLRFPLGVASFLIVSVFVAVGLAGIAAPLSLLFVDQITLWTDTVVTEPIGTWPLVVGGVVIVLVTPHVINGLAWLHRRGVEALLRKSAAEHAWELEQKTVVLEERNRLAQELHDAVGHTVTAATLQAGAAGTVFDEDPEYARRALTEIEDSGRRALGELDRILGLIRDDDAAGRTPPPDHMEIVALVEDTRRAGVPVTFETTGPLSDVPSEVGRALYRVAQEALTNVMKHAGRVQTLMRVAVVGHEVTLTVRNEAPSRPPPSGGYGRRHGHGLLGMRERVVAYGGRLSSQPTGSGGHVVEVAFPLDIDGDR